MCKTILHSTTVSGANKRCWELKNYLFSVRMFFLIPSFWVSDFASVPVFCSKKSRFCQRTSRFLFRFCQGGKCNVSKKYSEPKDKRDKTILPRKATQAKFKGNCLLHENTKITLLHRSNSTAKSSHLLHKRMLAGKDKTLKVLKD